MNKSLLMPPKTRTLADYRATTEQLLVEMNRLEVKMDEDRSESERLVVEIQHIKADTESIKARTNANLLGLKQQIDRLTSTR